MTIGFLCDENMPGPIVEALAARGLDVVWAAALCPGISDHEVLALAERQRRTLITLDKDFGELATKRAPGGHGVVLLRLPRQPLPQAAAQVAAAIAARSDWADHVSVIEPGRIRMRPLRKAP